MKSLSTQITFNAPVEQVWDFWADVENTPKWVDGVESSRITAGSKEQGKGLSWQEFCCFGDHKIQIDHEVTEWEAAKKVHVKTELPLGGSMQRTLEFKSTETGSLVNLEVSWDLGMAGIMVGEEKAAQILEKSFNQTSQNWKKEIDSE